MTHVMRKTVCAVWEQKNRQISLLICAVWSMLCCSQSRQYISYRCCAQNVKTPARFCCCAEQFESYLVTHLRRCFLVFWLKWLQKSLTVFSLINFESVFAYLLQLLVMAINPLSVTLHQLVSTCVMWWHLAAACNNILSPFRAPRLHRLMFSSYKQVNLQVDHINFRDFSSCKRLFILKNLFNIYIFFFFSNFIMQTNYNFVNRNDQLLQSSFEINNKSKKKSLIFSPTPKLHLKPSGSFLSLRSEYKLLYFMWSASWENLFMPYANNKGADQPVHSLISTFVVRCLDSIIYLVSISEISSL